MENKTIPSVTAIILAAGESKRMNGVDKVFAALGGKPVLAWSVEAFQQCASVDRLVLVVSWQNVEKARRMAIAQGWNKVVEVCAGGKRRQDSVAAGLAHVKRCTWVIVHDGARPFVTPEMIERGIEAAKETGSSVAAVLVIDTIKIVKKDCIVSETPPRQNLWAAQTPQIFRFEIITETYHTVKSDATDDASMAEQAGYKVKLYTGSYDNIKITTPDDLALAKVLVKKHGG